MSTCLHCLFDFPHSFVIALHHRILKCINVSVYLIRNNSCVTTFEICVHFTWNKYRNLQPFDANLRITRIGGNVADFKYTKAWCAIRVSMAFLFSEFPSFFRNFINPPPTRLTIEVALILELHADNRNCHYRFYFESRVDLKK